MKTGVKSWEYKIQIRRKNSIVYNFTCSWWIEL